LNIPATAKREKFFGWRLYLICTPDGLPVSFELLPAAYHDLASAHELTVNCPQDAAVYADKAYNRADDERSILAVIMPHS
jgi:IS5 family transposase